MAQGHPSDQAWVQVPNLLDDTGQVLAPSRWSRAESPTAHPGLAAKVVVGDPLCVQPTLALWAMLWDPRPASRP